MFSVDFNARLRGPTGQSRFPVGQVLVDDVLWQAVDQGLVLRVDRELVEDKGPVGIELSVVEVIDVLLCPQEPIRKLDIYVCVQSRLEK